MNTTDLHTKLLAFLIAEFVRKEGRHCISLDLLCQSPGFREEHVRSWTRDDDPEIFEDLAWAEQLVSAIIQVAEDDTSFKNEEGQTGPQRYIVCTHQRIGGRARYSFRLSPNLDLTDISASTAASAATVCSSSIHDLKKALAKNVESAEILTAMLDELAVYRAKDRLRAEPQEPADTSDLPPDAATGLYLDRPFDVDDLEWIKMACDAFLRGGTTAPRPGQLALVFKAIRRDDRATAEFLRVMNTIVLPLLRRLRLKEQPNLVKLGAAIE